MHTKDPHTVVDAAHRHTPKACIVTDTQALGVCLASRTFYPVYAGPAVRFQRYAPGLTARGIGMSVFASAVQEDMIARDGSIAAPTRTAAQDGLSPEWPLFEVIDGLPVQRVVLPEGRGAASAYFSHLAAYCEAHRDEIDVVQFLSLNAKARACVRRLRRLGIATVFTFTLLGEWSANPVKRVLQRLYWRLPFNLADCVVVSSGVMEQRLRELGVAAPIRIIPNGVDVQRFRPVEHADAKARLRQALGLDPAWQVVLAVGPIRPRKGTEVLVEAFTAIWRDHPEARLVLVGPRHDLNRVTLAAFRQQIQQRIASTDAQDRVLFTGAVSNVEDYLRAADLLVFPSRREGMPNVVPEAMACALPVITTPFIGLPSEFGTPGTHYVLSSWEPDVLAADLQALLRDASRRAALGEQARHWVEQQLDVCRSLDLYAALYREVAA